MTVIQLTTDRAGEVADVLCDAFRDYPVMRWVLGDAPDYPGRLRVLIGFFVAARVHRGEPMYGIEGERGRLAGAAILSWPLAGPAPESLEAAREAAWATLGEAERARYEAFGAAAGPLVPEMPHWHLNMIGVRRAAAAQGLGRQLLEVVHRHSREDPRSTGVSLSTELETNVGLYRHFGYRILGRAPVGGAFDTWALFREDDQPK